MVNFLRNTCKPEKEDCHERERASDRVEEKHETLGLEVEEAQRSPGIDDLHIAQLKKQKLKLKEEIERLSA